MSVIQITCIEMCTWKKMLCEILDSIYSMLEFSSITPIGFSYSMPTALSKIMSTWIEIYTSILIIEISGELNSVAY